MESSIHLRGMGAGQTLQTEYNPATKQHTVVVNASEGYVDKPLMAKFLTQENDGVTVNANGNYSDGGLGKTAFILKPKPGEVFMVARMIVSVKDTGSFDSGSYGNGVALVNGLTSFFRQDGVDVLPAFDPQFPIKTNVDWAAVCYDARPDSYGSGDEQLVARFTFTKYGKFVRLDGSTGDEFVIYCNDDMSPLVRQLFLMQGYYEEGPILE